MEQGLDFFVRREIVQRREEGCDIEAIEEQVEKALQRSDGLKGLEGMSDTLSAAYLTELKKGRGGILARLGFRKKSG
jgi:hypothetical protein